jgi:outer membrane protein insertion porin family
MKAGTGAGAAARVRRAILQVAARFVVCALVCAAPIAAAAQEFSFNSVSISGNERIEPATILSYAGIRQGETLTAGQLNDAYQRIVASGFFETVDFDAAGKHPRRSP